MNAEHVNIFINSAVKVFQKEMNVHLSRKDLSKKNSSIPSKPVSVIIGVTGSFKGQVIYSMDSKFAYKIAHYMLPKSSPDEIKRMENSAVSEIANMITGQASIDMVGEMKKISITPPSVLLGSHLKMDFLQLPTISLIMTCEMGDLEINIALAEIEAR